VDQFPKMKQLFIKTLQDLQLKQISSREWDLSGVSIQQEGRRFVVSYPLVRESRSREEPDDVDVAEGGESPSLELAIHLAVMIHFYQAR